MDGGERQTQRQTERERDIDCRLDNEQKQVKERLYYSYVMM